MKEIFIEAGDKSLLELIRSHDPSLLDAPCGGTGRCGKCAVRVWGEVRRLSDNKIIRADGELLSACGHSPLSPCRVELSAPAAIAKAEGKALPSAAPLSLAVDLGSTTLEMSLCSGSEAVGGIKALNAQRSFGADVLSRIENARRGEELSGCLLRQLSGLAMELCARFGAKPEQISHISFCGNTVMEHFAAGLDPSPIAVPPFTAPELFGDWGEKLKLRLPGFEGAKVYLSPCVSGYIGGDLTAGLSLLDAKELTLYMDIGTNAELALGDSEGFLCCSAAAGPAFEGAELSCGLSGGAGAICRVEELRGDIECTVIGGGKALGICGSGAVDALSVLKKLSVLGPSGKIASPARLSGPVRDRITQVNGEAAVLLSDTVYLSQSDIRALLLAKAAIAAGAELLLKRSGRSAGDIAQIVLSGGFGSSIQRFSAENIGLIPKAANARLSFAGNAALKAAQQALSEDGRQRISETAARCRVLELSREEEFTPLFARKLRL